MAQKKIEPGAKTAPGRKTQPASKSGAQKKGASGPKKTSTTGKKAAPAKASAPVKKPAAEKKPAPVKKAAPPAVPEAPRKKTIADRKVAWYNLDKISFFRWLAMIPLALMAFVFQFCLAGYSFSALVCVAVMGILLFYNLAALLKGRWPQQVKVVKRVFTLILCIGLVIVGITECFIIRASFGEPEETCEYMVVLGCFVRPDGPSRSLMDRINAAYDYLTAHPEVTAIVSGGQGADEPMTEAQCMYDQLVAKGIDPERIWMEDKATSTWENLHYSLDLIEEKTGERPTKIGLLSSEYHLFRASLFADACGVESVGIPARTSLVSQKINHFMREVAGVWHYILLGGNYND